MLSTPSSGQTNDYVAWLRATVLPHARTETKLPPALYADALKRVGIDIDAQSLIQRAELEFMEVRAEMQQLAPLVAREKGISATDYRDVIRALKRDTIPNDDLESQYRKVIEQIELIIRKQGIVAEPNRPMEMRLGTAAESAAQPAPHFLPAPLVGNTGQQGTFVLSLSNPALGADGAYDDFNYPSAVWTLAAHEGRPGHELQSSAMIERGVSLARAVFAANSVNLEGWALYAEAEMMPYEPLDAQLIALQFRLFRAARALLDPMLNLGLINRDQAGTVLTRDAVLSKAMVHQELDRYSFNMPGQAASYFYGYARIMELRMETELALDGAFDRLAFNNFLLDQGPLPPTSTCKSGTRAVHSSPARKALTCTNDPPAAKRLRHLHVLRAAWLVDTLDVESPESQIFGRPRYSKSGSCVPLRHREVHRELGFSDFDTAAWKS